MEQEALDCCAQIWGMLGHGVCLGRQKKGEEWNRKSWTAVRRFGACWATACAWADASHRCAAPGVVH